MAKKKIVESNYKIEATGKSLADAEKDFEKKKRDLSSKLLAGGASESVALVRSNYVGEFSLKSGVDPLKVNTSYFRVESGMSWGDLGLRANKVADLGMYDHNYTRQDFLTLSEAQQRALTGTRPTAGYEGRESYLDRISRIVR